MEDFKNQIIKINRGDYTEAQLLEYFQLIGDKLNVGSVQDVSTELGISQQATRASKKVVKIKFRSVLLVTSLLNASFSHGQ